MGDSKVNQAKVVRIDDIVDDIWNCIFYFLTPEDLLHTKCSCIHLHNLTDYNSKAAIKRYWKFQCSRLCSDVKYDDNDNNNINRNDNINIISEHIILDWMELYKELIQLQIYMKDNEKIMDIKNVCIELCVRVTNNCS